MRRQDPLIVGGGPAGSAAAIALASRGIRVSIVERHRETGDALCGGFMSWQTLEALERLGVAREVLGGHPIERVRIFAGKRSAEAMLPGQAMGVSRNRLDRVMLARACALGAGLDIEHVRHADMIDAPAIFLATGKSDVRGLARPREDIADPALGLRLRLPPAAVLAKALHGVIELHLFDGGYAGLLLQEDGSANLCLALRKSRLAASGGRPDALFAALARKHPALAARLAGVNRLPCADAVAAVPYGWRATTTSPGLFRLGDQAAVIPSLAGEGLGIAIASGAAAAAAFADGGPAAARAYQASFADRTRRPVAIARLIWGWGERPRAAALATAALGLAPGLTRLLAGATRIAY